MMSLVPFHCRAACWGAPHCQREAEFSLGHENGSWHLADMQVWPQQLHLVNV